MKYVGKMWTHDDDWWFHAVFEKTGDTFELQHLQEALKYVTDWTLAVDVGAHYGSWSRQLAAKFQQVISFEGRGDTFECLVKNTEHLPNVTTHNHAIGDRFDYVTIGTRPEHKVDPKTGKTSNSGISTFLGSGSTPMIPLDSLNLNNVGFIKFDIEGYELFAMNGAVETLARCRPVVIFEENKRCLEHGIQYGQCGEFLESLGARQVMKIKNDIIYVW